MTSLERQRRRKEKLAAFKSPLKKKLSKSHLLKRVTIWRPRKLSPEQALLETKMEASSLSIDRNTATAIDNEVSDLLRDGKGSCTVLQMINAISSSRNVIDIYAKSAGIEDALTERRRFLGMTFGRRSNKSDAQMARRYVFIGAFNKLEIDPASSRKVITSLEEAREELRKVLDFPPEEAAEIPKESKELEEEVDIVTKYTKKIELSVQSDIDDELRPSQEKWQEIASVSLAPQIGKESQGLDKADSAMLRRLDDEYEKRNQRLKSAAVQEIEEQERAKLARERAAELMRPLTDEEQQLITEAMETIGPESEVIAQVGPDSCQRGSLRTLLPGQWLNDEVIHYFLVMLSKRDEEMCQQDPTRKRCHLFKSFFITKLLNEGNANPALDGKYEYRNVKRWSKKVPGKVFLSLFFITFTTTKLMVRTTVSFFLKARTFLVLIR